jgi:hypothetical protein
MINPYTSEYRTVTTTETFGRYLIISIPEDMSTSSRYLSSFSLRINTEALGTINNMLNRFSRLVSKLDFETISNLLFQPTVFWDVLTFLERTHEFMKRIELRMDEHFQIEISRWIDDEVEGWNYLQIKVILLGKGMNEMSKKGIDKFVLLKSLISMATQILPQQTRQEVTVLVE